MDLEKQAEQEGQSIKVRAVPAWHTPGRLQTIQATLSAEPAAPPFNPASFRSGQSTTCFSCFVLVLGLAFGATCTAVSMLALFGTGCASDDASAPSWFTSTMQDTSVRSGFEAAAPEAAAEAEPEAATA